ncbi:MAG: hypothetical protein JWQ44_2923 [Chthoniobacter sp.]|nr:hypothetical protein [Chthoniobacter sp.]
MILVRIARGISDHFPTRATEWHMCLPAVYVGLALSWQPDLFSSNSAYANAAAWMGEAAWSAMFLFAACLRLIALTINGTFRSFQWSPIIRLGVAMFTAFAWGQLGMGFVLLWLETGRATFLMGILAHLVLVECFNIFRASRDWAEAQHGRTRLAKG